MSGAPTDRQERSWIVNARAWTEAVRAGAIESRRLATDAAVRQAVLARSPARVLDVGCGEGWLSRALAREGIEVLGVDGSAPLVEAARRRGGARFEVLSYAEVAAGSGRIGGAFDVAVCNFSLLGDDLVPLLRGLRARLAPGGTLLIQTVHPWAAAGEGRYQDGWRVERYDGLGVEFPEPMPWYFRTLASWTAVLRASGFAVDEIREPLHPDTGVPLSLLLAAVAA